MAKAKEKRINLRFDPKTGHELELKAAAEKVKFQSLGAGWFREWLRGERNAADQDSPLLGASEEEQRILRGLLIYMRYPHKKFRERMEVEIMRDTGREWSEKG